MTQNEINELLKNMVADKFNVGCERMQGFTACREVFEGMAKAGYSDGARLFKSIVLYTTILHPEMTDIEILMDFYKKMNGKELEL